MFSHHFSINTCSGFLDNVLIFRRLVLGNYGTVLVEANMALSR